jgi:hypothetical protein
VAKVLHLFQAREKRLPTGELLEAHALTGAGLEGWRNDPARPSQRKNILKITDPVSCAA